MHRNLREYRRSRQLCRISGFRDRRTLSAELYHLYPRSSDRHRMSLRNNRDKQAQSVRRFQCKISDCQTAAGEPRALPDRARRS